MHYRFFISVTLLTFLILPVSAAARSLTPAHSQPQPPITSATTPIAVSSSHTETDTAWVASLAPTPAPTPLVADQQFPLDAIGRLPAEARSSLGSTFAQVMHPGEGLKTYIVQRSNQMNDPDCITVGNMVQEDNDWWFRVTAGAQLATILSGIDHRVCSSLIPGYVSSAVPLSQVNLEVIPPVATTPLPAPMLSPPEQAPMPQTSVATPTTPTPTATATVPEIHIQVNSYPQAESFLKNDFKLADLIQDTQQNSDTGIGYVRYSLPPALAQNKYILVLLGQPLLTKTYETFPEGLFAVATHLPSNTWGALGAHVWVRHNEYSAQTYGQNAITVFNKMKYPHQLISELYLQLNWQGEGLSMYRPTDRIGTFVGSELKKGWIAHGSVYLCTDMQGKWRLREYPDFPATGDCAYLLWNWNPNINNQRVFDPTGGGSGSLVPQQLAQLNISKIKVPDPSKMDVRTLARSLQDNVGQSLVFRTNLNTSESDYIIFNPYIYLLNPAVLRDLIYNTPFASGNKAGSNQIDASPDLHYVTDDGYMGASVNPKALPMSISAWDASNISLWSGNYDTSFYVGFDEPDRLP